MQHVISQTDIGKSGRRGVEYPEVRDGLPVDRTVCPRCLGLEHESRACTVCGNKPVCPGCRNGRLVSVPGQNVNYDVCPLCCDRMEDHQTGKVQRFPSGAPRWLWYPERQREAVVAYQARRRAAARINAAPMDPWDEVAR